MTTRLVGENKGRITSRSRGRSGGQDRIERLIDKHVTAHINERRALVQEWQALRTAGVPVVAICEEYRVGNSTITDALRDPDAWCESQHYSVRTDGTKAQHRVKAKRPAQVRRRP